MSKYVEKFRKKQKDYEDSYYEDSDGSKNKHSRKREQKKMKYFDEYESYESHQRYNPRSQKFRI